MASKQNKDELTGLEKGLLTNKGRLEWNNKSLTDKLDVRTKFTIDLLKDNPEKLKEFYVIGDFWVKGFRMTHLKEYENKRGIKSMKHYVGNKYISPQPKSKEPTMVGGWSIEINVGTIELYDIDDNGMLVANEEKFKRYLGL